MTSSAFCSKCHHFLIVMCNQGDCEVNSRGLELCSLQRSRLWCFQALPHSCPPDPSPSIRLPAPLPPASPPGLPWPFYTTIDGIDLSLCALRCTVRSITRLVISWLHYCFCYYRNADFGLNPQCVSHFLRHWTLSVELSPSLYLKSPTTCNLMIGYWGHSSGCDGGKWH